jgi:hypothetical protein
MGLTYPAPRNFPDWPHFTHIVVVLCVICVTVLIAVNGLYTSLFCRSEWLITSNGLVALTGYETVSVFMPDFNVSQSFWYDRFIPGVFQRSKRKLCNPHDFTIGNSFTTNYSLFQWDLVAVTQLTDNTSASLVYKGSTLETCDALALYMNAHMQERNTDVTGLIACDNVDGFEFIAKTSFSMGSLTSSGKYLPPLLSAIPNVPELRNITAKGRSRSILLNYMLVLSNVLDTTTQTLQFSYQDTGCR